MGGHREEVVLQGGTLEGESPPLGDSKFNAMLMVAMIVMMVLVVMRMRMMVVLLLLLLLLLTAMQAAATPRAPVVIR